MLKYSLQLNKRPLRGVEAKAEELQSSGNLEFHLFRLKGIHKGIESQWSQVKAIETSLEPVVGVEE